MSAPGGLRLGLLRAPPRHLFFTGKGGVGKTSLACAAAIALADVGKSVLLVSTDPASNLDEMLGTQLTGVAMPVLGAAGLFAMNIDSEAVAQAYRQRVLEQMGPEAQRQTVPWCGNSCRARVRLRLPPSRS